MIDRRSFIYQSVLATAGLSLHACSSTAPPIAIGAPPEENAGQTSANMKLPYLDTIGIQLWTVREQMEADPQATLEALADIGYKQVELMDTRQIATLKPICDDLGLAINSSFMLWTTLTGRWELVPQEPEEFVFEDVLDQVNEGGLSHLVFGYLQPEERQTADDWRKRADELNAAGEKAKAAGVQMAYHNHNFEWEVVDGTTGFDVLVERMDGDLIPFELDLAWVAMAGKDPATVLTSIKDRTKLLHVKNLKPLEEAYVTLASMPDDSFIELGKGQLDIPALMRMGNEYGVDYCFYEQDNNWHPNALGSARQSLDFLRG